MMAETTDTGGLDPNQTTVLRPIEPSILTALPHYIPLGVFPLLIVALIYGGWWMLAPFLFMSIAGPADKIFGQDGRVMDPKKTPERRLIWHNLPVWTWAILWPPTLIFGMYQILVVNPFAIWEDVCLIIILTMEAQAVFVVGHELIHRRTGWERRLAEFLLASASYPQYASEHVYIHHAHVGLPDDAGSPPKGESFWHYFPKEVASNLTNSWKVARDRLARKRLSVFHYSNPFWRYGIGVAFWYGVLIWMGGIWAVPVYLFLSLGCVFSMKLSNYFQHYGLRRVRLPNGKWEKIMPRHSWSADWRFSNWLFFNMQRHADHHAAASRHYPLLQSLSADESPSLPGTYGDMMSLVIKPKKWFEKMDPIVDHWRHHFYPEIEDWAPYDSPLAGKRPESFDAIVEIFGAAPRLAKRVERNPELLDNLQEREFTDLDLPKGFGPDLEYETTARQGLTRLYWTLEMSVQEMRELMAEIPATDSKETTEVVRNWSNDKSFQIGMHVVRGNLSPTEAKVALSNLAEAAISTVLESVVADHVDRRGDLTSGGLVAVLLGDLASKEAYPGVPMDVIFVYDGENTKDLERICQRFRKRLIALTTDNLLFAPMSKKSSHGEATTLESVENLEVFDTSDKLAMLTRARVIYECGESELGERFDARCREILANDQIATSHREALLNRTPNGDESNVSSYADRRGGLDDIEKAARLIQLTERDSRIDDTAPVAQKIFEEMGSESLIQAAQFWRQLQGVHRLVGEQSFDVNDAGSKVKLLVATACGYENFDELSAAADDIASSAVKEIDALFARA